MNMPPGPHAEKADWRAWAKHLRPQLPDSSPRICLHLEGLLEQLGVHTVLAYRALPNEIRLGNLISNMPELQWLTSLAHKDGRLTVHDYNSATQRNRWGLLEPPESTPALPLVMIEAVLVPGLVFDQSGSRLGFGRGYYDRLFAKLDPRIPRIGVSHAALVTQRLPTDPWDVAMTHLVTGSGVEVIRQAPPPGEPW